MHHEYDSLPRIASTRTEHIIFFSPFVAIRVQVPRSNKIRRTGELAFMEQKQTDIIYS